MRLSAWMEKLKNCPCGREHKIDIRAVEIGEGYLAKTAEILSANHFPRDLLLVCDTNTLAAAHGIEQILSDGGFTFEKLCYPDLRTADMTEVERVSALAARHGGILSVGTGSLNDICRLASLRADRAFAIFATAPSMDGFASGDAPITAHNFKVSYRARQPQIILADTAILASAPQILKSAGYGDMLAKAVGLVDWRIAQLTIGEYLCPRLFDLTKEALNRIISLTDAVTQNSKEAAGAIMEALVLTGIAMKCAGCSRPGSGAEHIVAHFWEVKKLEMGQLSDFHGRKVAVATLLITRLYKEIVRQANPLRFHADTTDWTKVYEVYGDAFRADIEKLNTPTVTAETSPEILRQNWGEISRIVREELPAETDLHALLLRAGAPTTIEEIHVTPELAVAGMQYHPYMRHRMTLSRLLPMLDVSIDWNKICGIETGAETQH